MRGRRSGWDLKRVRRVWAQGVTGKWTAVVLGVAMLLPSFGAAPFGRALPSGGV